MCDNAKGGVYQQAAGDGMDGDTYVGGNVSELTVTLKHLQCAGGAEVQVPIKAVWTAIIRFIVKRALHILIEIASNNPPAGYRRLDDNNKTVLDEVKLRKDTQITFHVPGQAHDNIYQFIRGCFTDAFGAEGSMVLGGPFNPLSNEVDTRRLAILSEARSTLNQYTLTDIGVENITETPTALLMLDLGGAYAWAG